MHNHYEAAQAIEIGRVQDVVLGFKFLLYWVDNLGVPYAADVELIDDFEE